LIEHKAFFLKLEENAKVRFVLPRILSERPAKLPPDIVNKIMTFAFHKVICGNSTCHQIDETEKLSGERACPIIYEFTKKRQKEYKEYIVDKERKQKTTTELEIQSDLTNLRLGC